MSVRSDRWSFRFRQRVNKIQIVSNRDPVPAYDPQDFVFNVAVERDICEGRRGSRNGQGLCAEIPSAVLVTENELSSLVGGGIDNHE